MSLGLLCVVWDVKVTGDLLGIITMCILSPRFHSDGTKLWWLPSQMAEGRAGAGLLQRDPHQNRDREGILGGQTETRPQPSRRGDTAQTKGRVRLWEVGMLDQDAGPFLLLLRSALLCCCTWLIYMPFCNTGPSDSVDPGPLDQRGIQQQHPAECRTALSSGLPEHKLSGSRQSEYQPKVGNTQISLVCLWRLLFHNWALASQIKLYYLID